MNSSQRKEAENITRIESSERVLADDKIVLKEMNEQRRQLERKCFVDRHNNADAMFEFYFQWNSINSRNIIVPRYPSRYSSY